jgi:hypothetical protein
VTALTGHHVAVTPSVGEIDPAGWLARFDDMFAEVVAAAFFRREPRVRARRYLLRLVSGLERKNGWTLAEFAGEATPDRRGCSGSTPALRGRSPTAGQGVSWRARCRAAGGR